MTTAATTTAATTTAAPTIAQLAYGRRRTLDPIRADDREAQEKLRARIKTLVDTRQAMKAVNEAFRMKAIISGNEALARFGFTLAQIDVMRSKPAPVFKPFELQNIGQNIIRLERRLEDIEAEANRAPAEDVECEGYRVVENIDMNRIQLLFDTKPDTNIRAILKSKGFRWAPSQDAWQRQLNSNGRNAVRHVAYALKRVAEAEAA